MNPIDQAHIPRSATTNARLRVLTRTKKSPDGKHGVDANGAAPAKTRLKSGTDGNPSSVAPLEQCALDYAARGWRVFPLHHVAGGKCSCGKADCGSAGKHPRTKHGPKDATTHPATIRRWWKTWPSANIGVCTGPENDIWMLGPDGQAGIEALAALEREHGDLPRTPRARSGSGGRHLIFRWPSDGTVTNRRNHRDLPIDVRGEGGYFVAAPSTNANGCYVWEIPPLECEPAEAPSWLLAWCREDGRGTAPLSKPAPSPAKGRPKRNGGSAEDRAIAYLDKLSPAISGQGGHDRTMEAARVVVYGFDLGAEAGYRVLSEHYNPRCQPQWSERELRHKCAEADTVPFGKPRGWLLESRSNGHRANSHCHTAATATITAEPAIAAEANKPPDLVSTLLAHLRTAYDPLHRREQLIWSRALGRAVDLKEAGQGPSSTLLTQLLRASDCPLNRENIPSKPTLLRNWRSYLSVAWADLLASLPEESATEEVDAAAEAELRRHLASLLGRVVSIGRRVGDGRECDVQARSLLDCCLAWAVPGQWGRMRSYWIWSRQEGDEQLSSDRSIAVEERRRRLRIALRVNLADQLGVRPLAEWRERKLSDLCEHYGIGKAVRLGKGRTHTVELARDFLDDLLSEPNTDREQGEEG